MSNFIELYAPISPPSDILLKELSEIVDISEIINTSKQICLTAPKGHEDNIFFGVGSLQYDWFNKTILPDGTVQVPKRNPPLVESDFTEICTPFKNTHFEKMIDDLSEKYLLGRVRIFFSLPNTCLSWHRDTEERIHYPIQTQEGCFMVIDDEVKHLEQNKWYYTMTTKYHTAFNGSKEKRIHFVANILGLQ